jgi:hypothetical protein
MQWRRPSITNFKQKHCWNWRRQQAIPRQLTRFESWPRITRNLQSLRTAPGTESRAPISNEDTGTTCVIATLVGKAQTSIITGSGSALGAGGRETSRAPAYAATSFATVSTSAEYRKFADECVASARIATTDDVRKHFLDLAKMWMTAAQQIDDGIAVPLSPRDDTMRHQ